MSKQPGHVENILAEYSYQFISDLLDAFFQGRDHDIYEMTTKENGHIWTCRHGTGFTTLTIEPPTGGQYEIAVRMEIPKGYDAYCGDKYSGYFLQNGMMHGRNTAGH